jgi:hypothetical protein
MQRRSTDRGGRWHRWIERRGPRRGRQALIIATALYLALILGATVLLLRHADAWERWLRIGLIALLALVALWLWLRLLREQWARLRVDTQGTGPETDDSGVWGVGGPGMRVPGNTGLTRILPRRRSDDDNLP